MLPTFILNYTSSLYLNCSLTQETIFNSYIMLGTDIPFQTALTTSFLFSLHSGILKIPSLPISPDLVFQFFRTLFFHVPFHSRVFVPFSQVQQHSCVVSHSFMLRQHKLPFFFLIKSIFIPWLPCRSFCSLASVTRIVLLLGILQELHSSPQSCLVHPLLILSRGNFLLGVRKCHFLLSWYLQSLSGWFSEWRHLIKWTVIASKSSILLAMLSPMIILVEVLLFMVILVLAGPIVLVSVTSISSASHFPDSLDGFCEILLLTTTTAKWESAVRDHHSIRSLQY